MTVKPVWGGLLVRFQIDPVRTLFPPAVNYSLVCAEETASSGRALEVNVCPTIVAMDGDYSA